MTEKIININTIWCFAFAASFTTLDLLTPKTAEAQMTLPRNVVSYVESEYEIFDINNSITDDGLTVSNSENGILTASLQGVSNPLVQRSTVDTTFELDAASGLIRSSMDVDLRLDGFNGSTLAWGQYTLEGNTQAFIQDVINVNDSNFGFMEISIGYDGSMMHELMMDPDDASSAGIETYSALRTFLTWKPDAVEDLFFSDGDSVASFDTLSRELVGFTPKSKTGLLNVDSLAEPAIIPLTGNPASYTVSIGWGELARTRIYNIDGEYARSSINHDFTSTANLMLKFYDEDMNLITAPEFTSEQGINYQLGAVPEPGCLTLIGLAASIFACRRRRTA